MNKKAAFCNRINKCLCVHFINSCFIVIFASSDKTTSDFTGNRMQQRNQNLDLKPEQ